MTRLLDNLLDRTTMYRLVLYYLAALLVAAMVLSLLGILPHDPIALACSTLLILTSCWISNLVFSRVFEAPANRESAYITALILALILDPVSLTDTKGMGVLVFASLWATASKFILAVARKHLFNPAAFGVALLSPPADRTLTESEMFSAAGLDFEVFEAPGHSCGHVVFLCRQSQPWQLFGGDVLFRGSVGRTDLPGGSFEQLRDGIQSKLWPLPDDSVVYPGHGPVTTVGHEKQTNPFVGDQAEYPL